MNVGDIYWVEFPARGGRAQAGRRPAIVVQKVSTLPTVLIIPLTAQQDAYAFRVRSSLNRMGAIVCASPQSRSFNLWRLIRILSKISWARLQKEK